MASEIPPSPYSDVDRIPDTVARLRGTFDSGRTRPLEWRRAQLGRSISVREALPQIDRLMFP